MKMKDARTGAEMLDSWQELVGDGNIDDIKQAFNIYAQKMPSMLAHFTQQPLVESMERGTLDPKTRELVLLGMLAAMQCGPGIVFHVQGAVNAGASEEEIMEVMFLSAYEHAKVQAASIALSVEEGLKRAAGMKAGKSRAA
ncbi:MAG: carboxymuconolactone decarboxylase family protein [Gammaproteobacteria bacterium]|nr:carboxymuconolactone decarboxylase family protein [Gammaproteobacteria bacterium]